VNQPPKIKKLRKGFACLTKAQRNRIAQLGGMAVSGDSGHMAHIGRKGGKMTAKRYQVVQK
jgi:hypothetical protein